MVAMDFTEKSSTKEKNYSDQVKTQAAVERFVTFQSRRHDVIDERRENINDNKASPTLPSTGGVTNYLVPQKCISVKWTDFTRSFSCIIPLRLLVKSHLYLFKE